MITLRIKTLSQALIRNITISLLICVYFSTGLFDFITSGHYVAIITYLRLFISLILLLMSYAPEELIRVKKTYFIFFSVAFFSIYVASIYNGNLAITETIWYFQYVFVFASLMRNNIHLGVVKLFCIAFSLFFVFHIAQGHSVYLLETGRASRNAIGYGLTLLCVLYYISLDQNEAIDRFSFTIPTIMTIIVIWSGSRSGIISFVIILIGDLLGKGDKLNSKKFFQISACGMLICILCLYVFMKGYTDAFFSALSTKAGLNLMEDTRFVIIGEYISYSIDTIWGFFLGSRLNAVQIINRLAGNPHNMFVRLHANFGMIFFLLIMVCIIRAIIMLFKRNKSMAYVFLALLARGFSDIVGFSGLYDPIVYYFIFYYYRTYSVDGNQI